MKNKSGAPGERILLALTLGATAALMIAHLYSPFSMCLSMSREIAFRLSGGADSLVFYYPSTGYALAVNGSGGADARFRRPANEMEKRIEETFMKPGGVFFKVSLGENEAGGLARFFKRKNPKETAGAVKCLFGIKKEGRIGLSWHDTALLTLEFLGFDYSNLVIVSLSGDVKEDWLNFNIARRNMLSFPVRRGGEIPKVLVLNASEKNDAAYKTTRFLRSRGVDVVDFGNYARNERETKIVNYSTRLGPALALRKALGMENIPVRFDHDPSTIAEAAVIIGKDFDESFLPKMNY